MDSLLFTSFLFLTALSWAEGEVSYDGRYSYAQTLQLSGLGRPVGYRVTGELDVLRVHPSLLRVQLLAPSLQVISSKTTSENEFVDRSSQLESVRNDPFFLQTKPDGQIKNLLVSSEEILSLVNIKRAIASLLQFQDESGDREEKDVSGTCSAAYQKRPGHILKNKFCIADNLQQTFWGGRLLIDAETVIQLEGNALRKLEAKEEQILQSSLSNNFNSRIDISTEIIRQGDSSGGKQYSGDLKTVVNEISGSLGLISTSLQLEVEDTGCESGKCPQLSAVVKENKKSLKKSEIGSSKSAWAYLKVLRAAKRAGAEEIFSLLNSKETKGILAQIMDVLGAAQTVDTHQAALKKLGINSEDFDLDLAERYFWALSMSPHPQEHIVKDLVKVLSREHKDPKMWETLVLTLSAMTRKLGNEETLNEVAALLEEKLDQCKEDEKCRQLYLKALANLNSPTTLKTLLKYAVNSTKKAGVAAMYALKKLGQENWDENVMQVAERVLLGNSSDSSARALAADIIVDVKPNGVFLSRVLSLLKSRETPKETKEYLLQRLRQASDDDVVYKEVVTDALRDDNLLNYHTLAQGGLSTAFSRRFMTNGFLSTTQEISGGLLKKGFVHVNLENQDEPESVFTLGMFSGGLSSFVSSEEGEQDDEEEATGGLELTVLGVELRPFIFFTGQGELMGHVWSGTGSERTPAYQALVLVDDQAIKVPLTAGVVAEINLKTSASVDLSGQIEISLWNRNAKSLVQNSAGVFSYGQIKIGSSFASVQTDFHLMAEPRLDLSSSMTFSGSVALCLQLQQPNMEVSYKVNKLEKVPGSKFKLQRTLKGALKVPGKTYVLNAKNNEMCNVINGPGY